MSVTFEETKNAEEFDLGTFPSVIPFTQGYEYGEWQREVGRNVRRWVGREGGEVIGAVQLVQYPLAGNKNYWYAPYGPVWKKEPTETALKALQIKTSELGKETSPVFTRMEFSTPLASNYFKKAPRVTARGSYLQPRTEWVLDIRQSEELLLRGMYPNTRYSIRAAERRGVWVEIVEARGILGRVGEFYDLLKETARRDAFSLHPREYYEAAFRVSAGSGNAFLALAKHGSTLLAAHFIVCCGAQANFVFGGSSSSHRELMGSYAAAWAAIRKARALGFTHYNFGGVSSEADTREQWKGLSSFKRKFGGSLLEHGKFWDSVEDTFWYYSYIARKFLGILGI